MHVLDVYIRHNLPITRAKPSNRPINWIYFLHSLPALAEPGNTGWLLGNSDDSVVAIDISFQASLKQEPYNDN